MYHDQHAFMPGWHKSCMHSAVAVSPHAVDLDDVVALVSPDAADRAAAPPVMPSTADNDTASPSHALHGGVVE